MLFRLLRSIFGPLGNPQPELVVIQTDRDTILVDHSPYATLRSGHLVNPDREALLQQDRAYRRLVFDHSFSERSDEPSPLA